MTKKIIAMVLTFIMLITIATFATSARSNNNKTDKEFLYEHLVADTGFSYYYDEVYYHHVDQNNPDSEIDWAIVYCNTYQGTPSDTSRLVLDRVIVSANLDMYYTVYWAIYDAELNEIISIDKIDATKYDGLEEGLQIAKVGYQLGDADHDGELSVLDATYIQRAISKLCEFKNEDIIFGTPWGVNYNRSLMYYSDVDGDGERTILDATAIQLKLAGLE